MCFAVFLCASQFCSCLVNSIHKPNLKGGNAQDETVVGAKEQHFHHQARK